MVNLGKTFVVDSIYPFRGTKYVVDSLANMTLFKENGVTTRGGSCLVHRKALLTIIEDKKKKG